MKGAVGKTMLMVTAFGCRTEPEPEPEPRPPDVLLVVMDTVRADALSVYGNARPTSPQFDVLASQGVRFAAAVTPGSWTWPSHGSLFTGTWPWEHGAHFAPANGEGSSLLGDHLEIHAFSDTLPTLAEQFSAAGYQTVSISGNPLVTARTGITRGFQSAQQAGSDAEAIALATEALKAADDRPMLMFLNLYGAHAPYEAVPLPWVEAHAETLSSNGAPQWLRPFMLEGPAVRLFQPVAPDGPAGVIAILQGAHTVPPEGWSLVRDLYEGEVRRVDHYLGQAVEAWTGAGRTGVVAITSDHGEYFGEHGFVDHGRTLYGEVVNVPLTILAPGRLPAGSVVEAPVPMHALHDTLLDLAAIGTPTQSLLPVIQGTGQPPAVLSGAYVDPFFHREVGGAFSQPYRLLREGDNVLIVRGDGSAADEIERYDLATDPGMLTPLPASPELVDRLKAAIPPLVSDAGDRLQLDDQTAGALRELGYIGD